MIYSTVKMIKSKSTIIEGLWETEIAKRIKVNNLLSG